jgi:hypothetical protein
MPCQHEITVLLNFSNILAWNNLTGHLSNKWGTCFRHFMVGQIDIISIYFLAMSQYSQACCNQLPHCSLVLNVGTNHTSHHIQSHYLNIHYCDNLKSHNKVKVKFFLNKKFSDPFVITSKPNSNNKYLGSFVSFFYSLKIKLDATWLNRNTNKMQLCNRIYYSEAYWMLSMFRAAHRSSSGVQNCIFSLWYINQKLQIQFRAPDNERCAARNMLSIQ